MSPGHPPTVLPHDTDARLVERVDGVLADYLARRAEDTTQVHSCITEATDALNEFVLAGGKRVRPTFAWWGWRGAGGQPDGALAEPVLRAISALELVQANALVHDDVMDASDTRRGRPTVHVAFAQRHREQDWLGSSDRFGAGVAILLGDLAMAWADDLFHDSGLPERIERRARQVWAGMRTDMLSGQYLDVRGQASGDDSLETALRIDRYKTAAYTIERPLQLGAALGDASAELESAYRRFGADLGVAFQLRDDQLGVFGDPEITGKPAGDDVREGKRTVLMALAFQTARARSDDAALTVLTSALGNSDLTDDDVARVRGVLDELGASADVEGRIERLTESALIALSSADLAEPAATRLPELALAATRRMS